MPLQRRIAYIDLSNGKIRSKPIPEEMERLFLGGRGLDAYLLYNYISPGLDPMSPENVLLVSAGLLSGTHVPSSGRCHIAAKSPLTGILGSTNMGGFFAPELRRAGFDHLVVQGKAPSPVYLWVHDGEIEIRDASHLWGKDTFDTQELLRSELGSDRVRVLCIGPAGENLVKYACVKTEVKNAGARTGMGCVMGAKKLKAIAARGTKGLEPRHRHEAAAYCDELRKQIMSTKVATALSQDGTLMIWNVTNTSGLIRVKNFTLNKLEEWEELTVERFHERYRVGSAGCFGCPVLCRHQWQIKEGEYAGLRGEGPDYITQLAFGGLCSIKQWEPVLVGQYLCDKYGLDIAEVGNLFAWAMELHQKGIIDNKTSGLDLEWGNAERNLPIIIEQIAKREGFGAVLAQGAREAARIIGKGSERYLIHIKGLSNIGSDERPTPALALGIATATRGSDHMRSRPALDLYHLPQKFLEEVYEGGPISSDYTSYVGKAREIWWMERLFAVADSLGVCKFLTVFLSPAMPKFEEYSKLIYYIIGLDISPQQLREIGERIYTLERMFNCREGLRREEDHLPERYYTEPTPIGLDPARGKKIDKEKFEEMLDEYYALHGWDNEGVPTQETLQRLGLDKEPSHML